MQAFKEALHLGLRVNGEKSHITGAIYYQMMMYYIATENVKLAYEYTRKCYDVCLEVFGIEYVQTIATVAILNEPMFVRMAEERGDDVPEMPSEDIMLKATTSMLGNMITDSDLDA